MSVAYCYRDGSIRFSEDDKAPAGVFLIARSSESAAWLRKQVAVKARHAKNGQDLFVPGMAEADGILSAARAAWRWQQLAFPGAPDVVLRAPRPDEALGAFGSAE
jgi:hypothetical protein